MIFRLGIYLAIGALLHLMVVGAELIDRACGNQSENGK
jgi:hypothetical protein